LLQVQKLESMGLLAGGVAHDFNNMLEVILARVDVLLDQLDPAHPFWADIQEIRKAANRSADFTRQLLAFARKQPVVPKSLDLKETVAGMLKMLRSLISERIDLVWLPGSNIGHVKIDPNQIHQILANLCLNARDSIKGNGIITIKANTFVCDEAYCAEHADVIPGEYVLLTVNDNGCGMDKETLGKIFEPFFTTKEVGKGTGLGLSTVYGIVKQNRGFINVCSEPGQGTTFSVYLPQHIDDNDSPPHETEEKVLPRGHETILLAEDESMILDVVTEIFEGQGYTVLVAATPDEAIRLARAHAGEIHLLVTDMIMPKMNGLELAGKVLAVHPKLKCLFMSGYTADVVSQDGIVENGTHFIQKPFSRDELCVKVREVLDAR
jgi:two-component system, cell cycle sensor histidine kinase and response regulator CckA